MPEVKVIFSDAEYPDSLGELAQSLKDYPAVFVIADRAVRQFVTEPLAECCAASGVALRGVFDMRTGERFKTLKTVERIQRWLIGAGAGRDALIVAVGGGITTDLAGFVAATYKRGIRYVNVPTTLLAMVDASVGGKTGCNTGPFKNMCGAFLQPEFTFISPCLLKTLPWREFSAGYAELLKTFIIGDAAAYVDAVRLMDGTREDAGGDLYGSLAPLVRRAVGIKSGIVERDFRESGERRLLNLGHTFAHAIEARSSRSLLRRCLPGEDCRGITFRRISHGHAVAMGIVMAARKSQREGVAVSGLADRIEDDFSRVGLPVQSPWSEEELMEYIRTDKKAVGGVVPFVLIEDIGKVK